MEELEKYVSEVMSESKWIRLKPNNVQTEMLWGSLWNKIYVQVVFRLSNEENMNFYIEILMDHLTDVHLQAQEENCFVTWKYFQIYIQVCSCT